MEASVAGMPPAAAEQPTGATASEQVQPQVTEQPVTEQTTAPEIQQEEGMEGAFQAMKASFDQFMASQQNPAEDTSLATDLLSALEAEPEVPAEQESEVIEPQGTEQQLQNPEAQAQMNEAKALIASVVREQVTPLQRELAARDMKALSERYPDMLSPNVLPKLTNQINELVALTDNPDLIYNAPIVEKLYKVVLAESADASAIPAEQAANQGASLETHAGQTQAGDPSLSDKYKEAVYQPPKPSVFG